MIAFSAIITHDGETLPLVRQCTSLSLDVWSAQAICAISPQNSAGLCHLSTTDVEAQQNLLSISSVLGREGAVVLLMAARHR